MIENLEQGDTITYSYKFNDSNKNVKGIFSFYTLFDSIFLLNNETPYFTLISKKNNKFLSRTSYLLIEKDILRHYKHENTKNRR